MESKRENMVFAQNLKNLMSRERLTINSFAKKLNTSPSLICDYVNGKKMPRMKTVDIICQFFNCRRSDLLDPTGDLSHDESGLIEDYRLLIPEERRIARNLVSDMAEKYKKRAAGSAS